MVKNEGKRSSLTRDAEFYLSIKTDEIKSLDDGCSAKLVGKEPCFPDGGRY